MLFDRLGTGWADYRDHLANLRALVVDDEPLICRVLEELLTDEGFEVDTTGDAESAWELIRANTYDLLVTDKNLPGRSGVDLIGQIQFARIDLPSVLITGFASIPSVSEALRYGATDYIAKPFPDIRHVIRRLKSVADRRISEKLYARVTADLKQAVASTGEDEEHIQSLARDLFAFKGEIARRLSVLVVDPNIKEAFMAADTVARRGLSVELVRNVEAAVARLERPNRPLTVVVSLDLPNAIEFIQQVREEDPLMEFLASSAKPNLPRSLKALTAGAADFVNVSGEGIDVLRARAVRLVDQARRQRLHVHLITALYRRLKEFNHPAAASLRASLPEAQQVFLDTVAGPIDEDVILLEEEVDLSDLLEEVEMGEIQALPEEMLEEVPVELPPVEEEPVELPVRKAPPLAPPTIPPPPSLAPKTLEPILPPPGRVTAPPPPVVTNRPAERRAHKRVPAALRIRYQPIQGGVQARETKTRDVSLSGMFIVTNEPLALGSRLRLEVYDSNGILPQPVVTEGEVVRFIMMSPDPESRSGVGVRLVDPSKGNYQGLVMRMLGTGS